MCEIIAAVSKNLVIGRKNDLPWRIQDDMVHFRNLTKGHVLIMGKNTYLSILKSHGKPLSDRYHIVITSTPEIFNEVDNVIFTKMENFDTIVMPENKRCFVIGGTNIYKHFLPKAYKMHITHIDKVYEGDAHFPGFYDWNIVDASDKQYSSTEKCHYRFLTYEKYPDPRYTLINDIKYLKLLHTVSTKGCERADRTGTGTISLFGKQLCLDISNTVPILTTKMVAWKSCIKELLWFLNGCTDANVLKQQGVHIWNGNTTRDFLDSRGLSHLPEGDIGCGYGFQWRHFGDAYKTCKDEYTGGFDQIKYIIEQLKTDPYSRRIFMSSWNPQHMSQMALPPCHVSAQFYVDNERGLSCHMYQRSVDCFLGLPFNIFSYTVLTYILATICDMKPKELVISMGDTHIYKDHLEQVNKQLERIPIVPPKLVVNPRIKDIPLSDISVDDFDVIGYFHHEQLKGNMSV